jgi:protein-L-isoaspartate(D-aspartate) O-methyltransferase
MTVQLPIPDYAAARRSMVDNQLRPQGVTDVGVIAAMKAVPREQFVPEATRPMAYTDRSLALGHGRLLASPAVHGQLLTQMAPEKGHRALVVGAGTGYSATLLAHIGCTVTALEVEPQLAAIARGLGLTLVEGPLADGHAAAAPYDIILIDGAVEFIPDALVEQLADGGRLGTALVERGISRMIVGRKAGGGFGYLSIGDAGVPALPGFALPRAFTF